VPRRQRFLWDGRIPVGHITVIAGEPSKGKSTLGYRIAADTGVPTIFVTTEEVDDTVWRPRLEASGVDLEKAFHHPELQLGLGKVGDLAELVDRYEAKLVIVDPLSNHLRDASVHRDEQVRSVLAPYMTLMRELDFSLVLQVHVLRSVPTNAHPLQAVPAGVVSCAKAIYLLGGDPRIGADPSIRILACADKFNFGGHPASLAFEYETNLVPVLDDKSGEWTTAEYGSFVSRGEVGVSSRALLVTMRPEDKDRKSDKVAYLLLELLGDGPVPVSEIRRAVAELDPPVSWRTAERICEEMNLAVTHDPTDARKRLWALPPETEAVLEEATSRDEIEIREVELPNVPDAIPEDWIDVDSDGEEEGEDEE
jgi:hypothetical protein